MKQKLPPQKDKHQLNPFFNPFDILSKKWITKLSPKNKTNTLIKYCQKFDFEAFPNNKTKTSITKYKKNDFKIN